MEDKLKTLVERIEKSTLTDVDKEELYTTITEGLRASVLPTLIKHIPDEKIIEVTEKPELLTVDSYVQLISDAVKDGRAVKEVSDVLDRYLLEVERLFTEEGV